AGVSDLFLLVARRQPTNTSGKPALIPAVSGSLRIAMPSTTAMAVLKEGTTTLRVEPTSFPSSKKVRNAPAVQTSDSTATQLHVSPEMCCGQCVMLHGTQHRATKEVAPATTTGPGTCASLVTRMIGPMV